MEPRGHRPAKGRVSARLSFTKPNPKQPAMCAPLHRARVTGKGTPAQGFRKQSVASRLGILLHVDPHWVAFSASVGAVTLAQRLASTLLRLREETGLSQVQIAKRLGVGRSTLNRLEAADQNTTLRTLDRLCRALEREPGELFERTDRRRSH